MSHRGYATETYERDYYGPTRERSRSRVEYDDYYDRRGREPEYLREDYNRSDRGALVLRERETEEYSRPREPSWEREREREREREVIIEPPVHQEVVTHHRHIDYDRERAPPRRSRGYEEEIDIHRRGYKNGREIYDDEIIFERESDARKTRDEHLSRRRSTSNRRGGYSRSELDLDVAGEADYYNNVVGERAYMGEAYNGSTRDWAIVDVPPGTERVTMDGAGGGSEEITWQRYNGVRRSKFRTEGDGRDDYAVAPLREREREREREETRELVVPRRYVGEHDPREDMWTEITKDLVVREAIEQLGYDFEETEYFFYVMDYLRYEDVLALVERSDELRRERRDRIKEMHWEREHPVGRRERRYDDDRIIEREIIYETRRPPGRYRH